MVKYEFPLQDLNIVKYILQVISSARVKLSH